jgi:predicted component of viral defense system (DUF524 family)
LTRASIQPQIVYENRLLLTYTHQVAGRLRRLTRALEITQQPDLLAETDVLQQQLRHARRLASFLDDVRMPTHLPTQTTMVLLKRPLYRAVLEGYLELHRTVAIRLEDPALEAPLENLPYLYQLWGTLQILAVLLDVAAGAGFLVKAHQLLRRDHDGLFVTVLPGGRPMVALVRPADGFAVRLTPEWSFGKSGPLHSVSFPQRPDVTVDVQTPDGMQRLYLFDSKYKLDGELLEGESVDGRPKKIDVDKMHAYRDAIRDTALNRVVEYAAILYPGPETRYVTGIDALSAHPGAETDLLESLRTVFEHALAI